MDEDGAHERAEHTPLWDPHAHCPGAWHPVANSDFLGLSVRKCNTWLQRVAGDSVRGAVSQPACLRLPC